MADAFREAAQRGEEGRLQAVAAIEGAAAAPFAAQGEADKTAGRFGPMLRGALKANLEKKRTSGLVGPVNEELLGVLLKIETQFPGASPEAEEKVLEIVRKVGVARRAFESWEPTGRDPENLRRSVEFLTDVIREDQRAAGKPLARTKLEAAP